MSASPDTTAPTSHKNKTVFQDRENPYAEEPPEKRDYLVKIDLKIAYMSFPAWHKHQKCFRFLWKDSMWELACLSFGLANAPWVFTKLLKLEVFILSSASTALNPLEGLGFVVNYEKSCLEPLQVIEFLCFEMNSLTLEILLPRDNIRNIRKK